MSLTLVISTLNSKYIHSSLAPWCLLAGIRKYGNEGIRPFVVEGTINENLSDVCERITEKNPGVIGFGCYIWNIAQTLALVSMIRKKLEKSVIILGGPEVSYNQRDILAKNPDADFVISGEGEKIFPLLVNAIMCGEPHKDIPGVSYRNGSGIEVKEPYVSCEEPPSPYTEEYFRALNGRIAYLETSRGCPYSCAFCLSGKGRPDGGPGIRFFDMGRAKKEIVMLANSGTKTVKFVDRTFNADKKRAREIFEFIISNRGKLIPESVCFHFEIAGDILGPDTIEILRNAPAGQIQLEIGLQSFNEKTLSHINRKTDTGTLKSNVIRLTEKENVHIHIDLIAGLPYEDLKSFENGFNTAYNLNPHMLQLGFLKLLHGSDMRENRGMYPCSYSESAPYEVTETPWISRGDMKKLHSAEDCLQRMYNSGRFRRTLKYLVSECGYAPFSLFSDFGAYTDKSTERKTSLDEYTNLVYGYFSQDKRVDPATLRDVMVIDRIASNSSGYIPESLKIQDGNLRKARAALGKNPKTGVRRNAALLYSERYKNSAVYCDYEKKNPVTGEFEVSFMFFRGGVF